jgi:hypothetical protein
MILSCLGVYGMAVTEAVTEIPPTRLDDPIRGHIYGPSNLHETLWILVLNQLNRQRR